MTKNKYYNLCKIHIDNLIYKYGKDNKDDIFLEIHETACEFTTTDEKIKLILENTEADFVDDDFIKTYCDSYDHIEDPKEYLRIKAQLSFRHDCEVLYEKIEKGIQNEIR